MSKNAAYANMLAKKIRALPPKAMHKVLLEAIQQVTFQTVQDSGNAAMNWNITKGDEPTPNFQYLYGVGEVGLPGEGRTLKDDTMAVVNAQKNNFMAKYPSPQHLAGEPVMVISNTIPLADYSFNARIHIAGISITSSLVNNWVKGALSGRP